MIPTPTPSHHYQFTLKEGTTGVYELAQWTGAAPYPHFHVKAKRSGKETLRVNADFSGRGKRGTLHLGNPAAGHLTGLYPQDAEHLTKYLGGSPDGDRDTWLVDIQPDSMTLMVFPNSTLDRLALFTLWTEGALDALALAKR